MQMECANHLKVLQSKVLVLNVQVKKLYKQHQVSVKKLNKIESLLKCRKDYCEVRLEIPANDFFVKKGSDTFDKAIVDAANTLQKNIRKAKEKQEKEIMEDCHSMQSI